MAYDCALVQSSNLHLKEKNHQAINFSSSHLRFCCSLFNGRPTDIKARSENSPAGRIKVTMLEIKKETEEEMKFAVKRKSGDKDDDGQGESTLLSPERTADSARRSC
eukprot:748054-Hanusia_phi.AAC.1